MEINFEEYKYVRVGAISPDIKIGDPIYNSNSIIANIIQAELEGVQILVFPELSLTGYTCGDLFSQNNLLTNSIKALQKILRETKNNNIVFAIGMPLKFKNNLYNCAVVIYEGTILGIIPKSFIPNYNEFYEYRWFTPAFEENQKITLFNKQYDFGKNILFKLSEDVIIGVEICEDLWVPNSPHIEQCLNGANIILNLSASNEVVGKSTYRENLVSQSTASCICGYVYCSSGQMESTTDIVFSGHNIIAENGNILTTSKYELNKLIYSDIDVEKLSFDRIKMNTYSSDNKYLIKDIGSFNYSHMSSLTRDINPSPFVPQHSIDRNDRCKEIFNIQAYGLIQRIKHTGIEKVVLGISGGLDSTLALLVCYEVMKKLNLPFSNIIGITMPGFGTTGKTLTNSLDLMEELGITHKKVNIIHACMVHFENIDHDKDVHDITFENTQARERTQILMDVANKENALVIGTGDLSELALGWCTYNGDHMSMYAINSSIPKTLVKHLVKWYAEELESDLGHFDDIDYEPTKVYKILLDIVKTKISPELLPPDQDGNIKQVTEDKIGPYELHDFFLYNMLRCGYSPKKIFLLATIAFTKYSNKEILKWMEVFYKRFFTQQFKRSCMPDGPKVGSVSLSPRGDWRMPSDASSRLWLDEIEYLKKNDQNILSAESLLND